MALGGTPPGGALLLSLEQCHTRSYQSTFPTTQRSHLNLAGPAGNRTQRGSLLRKSRQKCENNNFEIFSFYIFNFNCANGFRSGVSAAQPLRTALFVRLHLF
jgi:hypothetical protein